MIQILRMNVVMYRMVKMEVRTWRHVPGFESEHQTQE